MPAKRRSSEETTNEREATAITILDERGIGVEKKEDQVGGRKSSRPVWGSRLEATPPLKKTPQHRKR